MSPMFNHILIPLLVGVFLAINMGASGVAPSFSAAHGANLLKRSVIPGLFGLMVFIGALLAGKATANTMGKDLIDPRLLNWVLVSIVLLAVALSLLIANLLGVPQSTSQSTVLALTAPAIYLGQSDHSKLLTEVVPAWFITPVLSFVICYLVGKYIYNPIRRKGYFTYGNLSQHPVVKGIIIVMSLYVAFSIGSSNVANAAGPIASMMVNELNLPAEGNGFLTMMILSTLLIAPNFAIGASVMGNKVLNNTGKGLFLFGPFEAIVISFITASLLLVASVTKGIPTSLVQLNAGAIIGIGVARLGAKNIFRKTSVNKFFVVWAVAPVVAFAVSLGLTFWADKMGWLFMQ
ncbi:MAG: inorganic phosphate transporter [Breznakibacter sp.]